MHNDTNHRKDEWKWMASLALNASEAFEIISAEHDSTVPKWNAERGSPFSSLPQNIVKHEYKNAHSFIRVLPLRLCSDIFPIDTFTRSFQAWSTTLCTLNAFICMVLSVLCAAPLCIFIRAEVPTTQPLFGSRWKTHHLLVFLYSFSQMTLNLHLFSQTPSSLYHSL